MRFMVNILMGLATGLAAFAAVGEEGSIRVQDPWVRAAPASAKMLAAYMTLHNGGTGTRVLRGASSTHFTKVEIHNTVMQDGMARMVQQEQIELPAGSSIAFAPGGYHFMLMGPKMSMGVGDQVELILVFANGDEVSVNAMVRKDSMPMEKESMGDSGHVMQGHQH